ncbi:MAG: 3-dehydroquinate synthase [Actinomycetota bacterium]|nr:3-dehydroquinate synthase [Actinomycetota bacterium]
MTHDGTVAARTDGPATSREGDALRVRVGPGRPGDPGADGGYDVVVGRSLDMGFPGLLPGADQVLVVHSGPLAGRAGVVADGLRAAGLRATLVQVPDAEAGKTAQVLGECWAELGREGFTRSDAVVGVGGGAVTDLAGFVAASWLRGVRVVQVPTSLVGMVDAAVGGKTGINTAEGKNLVGAFHPPTGVLCDLDCLRTLPASDLLQGLAEVVKHGFIADPRTLELIENDPAAATRWDSDVLRELVERSVAVKADVVTRDLRESSLREILNYGHTFAHAIEQVEGYTWRHGNAVSVGLVYAAHLGHLSGRTPADVVDRHHRILDSLGLPTRYPADRWEHLRTAMSRDKKARGRRLRFVVLDAVARPGRLEDPPPALLEAAYEAVSS